MHYVYESIYIGIYTTILYICLTYFITNIPLLLVALGFIKHLLGYILGLHNYYCNHGYQCKKIHTTNKLRYVSSYNNLFIESLLEGIYFLIFGYWLFMIIKNVYLKIIFVFFFGTITHIVSELLEIHKYFCKTNCI